MSTCRATQKKPPNTESDDDEDEQGEIVFRPVMEQFGPHQMKKLSIFIRRIRYIDDAALGGYRSIVMTDRISHNRMLKWHIL